MHAVCTLDLPRSRFLRHDVGSDIKVQDRARGRRGTLLENRVDKKGRVLAMIGRAPLVAARRFRSETNKFQSVQRALAGESLPAIACAEAIESCAIGVAARTANIPSNTT